MTWTNITSEGLKADDNNIPFSQAMRAVLAGKNVFLTGEAGTGKTTFLTTLRDHLEKTTNKTVVVLAPTGIAAVNAGGQTIHSMFRLPFKPLVMSDNMFRMSSKGDERNKTTIWSSFKYSLDRIHMLNCIDLLIIDEVSMVRVDILQALDRLLRVHRKAYDKPFGGIQMLLVGDAFQLPPVVTEAESTILNQFYDHHFFFGSEAFREAKFEGHILTKVYRQQDSKFLGLLNRIREGEMTVADAAVLESKRTRPTNEEGFVIISTTREKVGSMNLARLNALPTPAKRFVAEIDGEFPESRYPMAAVVDLKLGAQVMITKNDRQLGVYNGTLAKVVGFGEGMVEVEVLDNNSGLRVALEHVVWENRVYEFNGQTGNVDSKVVGTFRQMPITLAWALTVHKSQGKTFDKVIADVEQSFDYGQEYVALSRCRSLENLHLMSGVNAGRLGPHPIVRRFYNRHFSSAR